MLKTGAVEKHCTRILLLKIVVMNGAVRILAGGIGLHCEYLRPLI